MNILKWMWKILPIMLLAVNATACNDDDDSGKRERPLTFEVTFLSLVCNYTRPVVVNAPFTGKDYLPRVYNVPKAFGRRRCYGL